MESELDSLEQKVAQVLAICTRLRSENHALRVQVAGLEHHKASLLARAETARTRLEALMDKLPAE